MEYLKVALESFGIAVLLMVLLEFAGRKSVVQFNIIQVVVFVSIGELAFLPIYQKDYGYLRMITVTVTLILFLVLFEYLEMKFNWLESLLSKKALILIDDGKLNYDVLKKQRMSVDQLESKLRLKGVANYEDLKTATIETNGEIGYEYKPEFAPITLRDLKKILGKEVGEVETKGNNMFDEIKKGHSVKHDKKYK